jgi:hypothetical protein
VYASRPLSPAATQHSLPSGRHSLHGPDLRRLDRTSLRLAHLFDHLVGLRNRRGRHLDPQLLRSLEVEDNFVVCDFRRSPLCMVSPDSKAPACPPSGRNSTYRPVQISGAGSYLFGKDCCAVEGRDGFRPCQLESVTSPTRLTKPVRAFGMIHPAFLGIPRAILNKKGRMIRRLKACHE